MLVVAAAVLARGACIRWWPLALPSAAARALPGLRVGGAPLDEGQPAEIEIRERARTALRRPVRLVVREGDASRVVAESTLGALGVSVDAEGVARRAMRLGRAGDIVTRARLTERARAGEIDVPMQPSVEPRAALEVLLRLKEDLDVPPAAARLDVERHAILPEKQGRALDVDAAIEQIAHVAAAGADADVVTLPMTPVLPRVTRASLANIDVSRVLASFSTYFSRRGDQGPRAQNIEVAASHLDGLIIEPGQLVSFNDVVGARSGDNGFQKAFEIFKGEMVEGTGGGTCQAASTLHAIAFFGGLDIVQRLPHSRPSAYIPVGLDATVAYPVVDLKLRNPYPFPVVVHAVVEANRVTMQLLGADKPARVALMRTVLSTTPFERKVVEDPAIDKPRRKQKGADGMKLLRKRLIAFSNGQSRVETSRDNYPPTTEIWKVPPGYDVGELPPLGQDFDDPDHPAPPAPPPPDPEQTIWGG